MAKKISIRKENLRGRTKVKTGCATCRIRKIKCDEDKPACKKCLGTGRACDGYDSVFKNITTHPVDKTQARDNKATDGSKSSRSTCVEIPAQDVELLSRYFSTKTLFDVDLGCDEEARQVLRASLTDPAVREAVTSLKTLREDLETSGDDPLVAAQPTSGHYVGLQQYNMALGGLASSLSTPGFSAVKSALYCCQIFISIEQVRKNYAAMIQHIIQGLGIMREYRASSAFLDSNKLVLGQHDQLPALDVFVIKMFAAPCGFADTPRTADVDLSPAPACSLEPKRQSPEGRELRTIIPDMRAQLKRISTSVLQYIDKVSRFDSKEALTRLEAERAALLDFLNIWLININHTKEERGSRDAEPVSESFLRLFHLILKVVLLGALKTSSDTDAEIQTGNDQLQCISNVVSERVRSYVMCSGVKKFPQQ